MDWRLLLRQPGGAVILAIVKTHDPRPLEPDERAVLDLVLSADFDGVGALRAQASTAVAVGRCECGCPSIDLEVADDAPRAEGLTGRLLPVEGLVKPVAEEPPGNIIVFVDDGRLSYLEYVYYDEPPVSWPALDRVDLVR